MASEQAAALADDFAAANAEAAAFARSCPTEAWARPVPGEEWTVGVTLHHIAESYAQSRRWVAVMAGGEGVTDTADMIDQANAAHAERASPPRRPRRWRSSRRVAPCSKRSCGRAAPTSSTGGPPSGPPAA